ncbi:hypothetical protein [Candidatus Parabeggiatoa sp. HSG14]|uniref:tetratricopeptide repeat protein n=1 Tax=Candidatus Parabeggiatoa sp. HSG14 TaxID=3055593 RepID=UPI0025A8E808|nr:hypothetical protein [Thiotrichales bacterium HSG14]
MKNKPPKKFKLVEHAAHARMIYNPSVWQQLPYIITYPLKGHALPILIIFSVVLWIVTINAANGALAFIVFVSLTIKYAYGVLEYTILGHATPPALTFDMANPFNQRPFKQILYLFVVVMTYHFIQQWIGNTPALIILVFGLFLTPASAAIIANQNNIASALNPLALIFLVRHIGVIYILISLFFGLLVLLSLVILSSMHVVNRLVPTPGWVVSHFYLLFVLMGSIYLLLMTFHLLGFVIYHRRDSLGVEVFFSPEKEADAQREAEEREFEKILDEVYWLSRQQNRTEEAIETLFAKLPELGDTPYIHEKLFDRMRLWENKSLALAQGQYYIASLIHKKRLSKALPICQACFKLDAKFNVKNAYHRLPLATIAYQQKRYPLALRLIQNFATSYPNHPDMIAIQLLTAKILGEHFKHYDKAKAVMVQLLKHKDHPLYPDIKSYATLLVKITPKK